MARVEVHDLFLRFMGAIYLFAFASLYQQLPGLYGEKGILPASLQFPEYNGKEGVSDFASFLKRFTRDRPTLLWISQAFSVDLQSALDLFALAGIAVASITVISRWARNLFSFGLLWLLYLSLHSVGEVFLWFQWDALLLEAGFLAFVFAPIPLLSSRGLRERTASICMWPVRWLFFRLMFMSGVVKLQSQCPTWWKLTALHHHYESQCIPTMFAWYIHQLPGWFDKLTVFHALFSEIVVPFFFFAPTRGLRKFAFYNQLVLQLGIILTGNYNFFNLLTITLSLSLLDDEDLGFRRGKTPGWLLKLASTGFNVLVVGGLLFVSARLFNMKYDEQEVLKFSAGFGEKELSMVVREIWPMTVFLAVISLFWNVFLFFRNPLRRAALTRLYHFFFLVLYSSMALSVFMLSLVPYSTLSPSPALGSNLLGSNLKTIHRDLQPYNIVHSYGLFRRMTGVEGRPELILEGSDDKTNWKEYAFLYKPGNVHRPPPFIVPHQPRLDWQMWFAALSDRNSNPWIYSFVHRLLKGEKSVLRLMDPSSPYLKSPPKYIRGTLYKYWFTGADSTSGAWWRRKREGEWLAPVSLEDESFQAITQKLGLVSQRHEKFIRDHKDLRRWLQFVRAQAESLPPTIFIWSLSMVTVIFAGMLSVVGL